VHDFLQGVEQLGWVVAFSKSNFWYGLVTAMHYFTFFVLTGTAVAFDLRLLGLVAKKQRAADFADEIFPWIWTSMALAVFSGFGLAIDTASDYYAAPSMRWKITITVFAFLCTAFIRRNIKSWDAEASLPGIAKVAAMLSVLLWLGVILAGNDIAAVCGLG
jgi:hypothetical protein